MRGLCLAIVGVPLFLFAQAAGAMDLRSTDVADSAMFPKANVCAKHGGSSVSPQLSWSGVPSGAKSLALTMFDPDARGSGGFWHWVVLDIPVNVTSLAAGAGGGSLPQGAMGGSNGIGTNVYLGPCPPDAIVHHYQITLYALPDKPELQPTAKPEDAGAYLAKHALATARITPVFQKP
jgi:hypothetical protein